MCCEFLSLSSQQNVPTGPNNKPKLPILIAQCGEMWSAPSQRQCKNYTFCIHMTFNLRYSLANISPRVFLYGNLLPYCALTLTQTRWLASQIAGSYRKHGFEIHVGELHVHISRSKWIRFFLSLKNLLNVKHSFVIQWCCVWFKINKFYIFINFCKMLFEKNICKYIYTI